MSKIQQAYEWVKSFSISSIKNIDLLRTMTIRKLKAIALKMNKQLGLVISKSMFGKTMSNMTKLELTDAIWYVRSIQLASPRGSQYDIKRLAERIFSMVADPRTEDETVVCHYFGFNTNNEASAKQLATRFYNWVSDKCHLVSMRQSQRLPGFEIEVKVWGIKPSMLNLLINKQKQLQKAEVVSISHDTNNFTIGDRFVVVEDDKGWLGNVGKIVQINSDNVWAVMDNSPGGKVLFKKSCIELEEKFDVESWRKTCQKMYDLTLGKSQALQDSIIKFIERRGFRVNENIVEVG